MILICTGKHNAADAKRFADALGDETFPLAERLQGGRGYGLFSARPYVLVADFKTVFSRKFLAGLRRTRLQGSRILYCVFVGASPRGKGNSQSFARTAMYDTLAGAVLRGCGLVLFGCEAFCRADEAGLGRAAAYVRDARPFARGAYPLRARPAPKS